MALPSRRSFLGAFALAAALSFARPAAAEELTADQLAARLIQGSGFTWEGAKTNLRMVLRDSKGESERKLEVLGRRHDNRLETVVRFLAPSGTSPAARS